MMLITERSFKFAVEIICLYKYLINNKEYILSKQILRSGTSIGANVEEAQAGQSKKDFIAKMSIASKEARETNYWLRLLKTTKYLDNYNKTEYLFKESESIKNIIMYVVTDSHIGPAVCRLSKNVFELVLRRVTETYGNIRMRI